MLDPRMRCFFCLVITYCAVFASGAASAQIYRWIDPDGVPHLSDTLPSPGTFADLEVYEGGQALSPLEARTLQIVAEEAREAARDTQRTNVPAAPAGDDARESPMLEQIRRAQQSAAGENVRDPCLLSWDPKCVEKNARNYVPGFGYAPSMLRDGDTDALASAP